MKAATPSLLWTASHTLISSSNVVGILSPACSIRSARAAPRTMAPASQEKAKVSPLAFFIADCGPPAKSSGSHSAGVYLRSLVKLSRLVNQPAPIQRPE